MSKDNITLELKLVYLDCFDRVSTVEDCDTNDFAECLKWISRLKDNGWIVDISQLEKNYNDNDTVILTIKASPKDSELWCEHRFIFIKKVTVEDED